MHLYAYLYVHSHTGVNDSEDMLGCEHSLGFAQNKIHQIVFHFIQNSQKDISLCQQYTVFFKDFFLSSHSFLTG